MSNLRESSIIGSSIALAGAFIGLGLGIGLSSRHEPAAPRSPRYQLSTNSSACYLVDTETGKAWRFAENGPVDAGFFSDKR
jgi:hypothetical protein